MTFGQKKEVTSGIGSELKEEVRLTAKNEKYIKSMGRADKGTRPSLAEVLPFASFSLRMVMAERVER